MRKKTNWDFTLWLSVDDPKQLLRAALAHPDAVINAMKEADFRDEAGVDIQACLEMLLDPGSLPGCSIQSSTASASDA